MLDSRDGGEPVLIAVRDGDAVLIDDPEVVLDQSKHVEVLEETRRVMEAAEGRGHARRHLLRVQRLRRHRGPGYELEYQDVESWNVLEHAWTDAGARGRLRVEHLVGAIDGQQLGRLSGYAHHVAPAPDFDQVVLVRQPSRELRDLRIVALPQRNPGDGVVESGAVGHRFAPCLDRTESVVIVAGTSWPKTSTRTWPPGTIPMGR